MNSALLVTKAPLSINNVTIDNKHDYDGNTTASGLSYSNTNLTGKNESDNNVTLNISNYKFNNKKAGLNKLILYNYALTGTNSGNYYLAKVNGESVRDFIDSYGTSYKIGGIRADIIERDLDKVIFKNNHLLNVGHNKCSQLAFEYLYNAYRK